MFLAKSTASIPPSTPPPANNLPTVQPILYDIADVDPNAAGLQIYTGSTVKYSSQAADADNDTLTWTWKYRINQGQEIVHSQGTGAITAATHTYFALPGATYPMDYVWTLSVSDGKDTVTRSLNVKVLAQSAGPSPEPGPTPTPGAVKELNFDDLRPGGRVVGKPEFVDGPVGKAMSFGGGDYVEIDMGSRTSISGAFTVSMWFNAATAAMGTQLGIIGSRNPSVQGFELLLQSGDSLRVSISDDVKWLKAGAAVALQYAAGEWRHVVFAVDPSGYTAYVNGVQAGSGNFTGTPLLFDGNHKLTLGWPGYSSFGYFKGSIDEVQIFDRTLTSSEANVVFLEHSDKFLSAGPPQSPIVAEWKLDGNTDDAVGTNDLVLKGNAYFEPIRSGATRRALRVGGWADYVGDYASIPNPDILNMGNDSFSVSSWVKLQSVNDDFHRIINKYDINANKGFIIDVNKISSLQEQGLRVRLNDGINDIDFIARANILAGEWFMITVSVDRSSAGNRIRLYLNDREIGTTVISALTGSLSNTVPLGVGVIPQQDWHYYKSAIAELGVYKQVLTAEQIKTRFENTNPTFQSKLDIVNGLGEFQDFMRARADEVAGYLGIVYLNSDGLHANANTSWTDQLSKMSFGNGIMPNIYFPGKVMFGNSSTAYGGPGGNHVARAMLLGSPSIANIYSEFIDPDSPALSFIPGHRDDGRDWNNANVEWAVGHMSYVYSSAGSSGGELEAIESYMKAAGAFKKEVFNYLKSRGLLLQTLRMLDDMTRVDNNPTRYLSGEAHPQFNSAGQTRMMDMVRAAYNMTLETVPPMPKLVMVSQPPAAVLNVTQFDSLGTLLYSTPQSIATVYRENVPTKVFELDAASSVAADGTQISEFNWVVTRGDANKVRIVKLNTSGSKVRVEIDYHNTDFVTNNANGSQVVSNLVEVALFLKSDKGTYSAPAYFTSYSIPNDKRVIENGRIKEINYDLSEGPLGNGDNRFYTPKAWNKDVYKYDASGSLLGWDRYRNDGNGIPVLQGEYDASGNLIVSKDEQGRVTSYQPVTYGVENGSLRPFFGPVTTPIRSASMNLMHLPNGSARVLDQLQSAIQNILNLLGR